LHPVVPLNSLENLDFSECLQSEIENALKDVRSKEEQVESQIKKNIARHKIYLRSNIMQIREGLKTEFDEFFNSLL
jgi:hypothetical protein